MKERARRKRQRGVGGTGMGMGLRRSKGEEKGLQERKMKLNPLTPRSD